jgi:DNA gyrase subunit A
MTIVSSHEPTGEGETAEELTLLTVCENGFGKRTLVSEYRSQNRGGKGLIDIQTDGRNGPVVQTLAVTNSTGLMLITSGGKIIRTGADNVSVIGRNTRGVKLIDLDEGEKVVAVAPAPRDENGTEEAPASTEADTTSEKPE